MNKKVMIVDDDGDFLNELAEALFLNGFETVAVNHPEFVIDIALQTKPDVIIMDLKMPGKSGFQLADEIHHLPALQTIPAIAMSGCFTKDEQGFLMNTCGIRKCLKKPFHLAEVISSIQSIIAEKK